MRVERGGVRRIEEITATKVEDDNTGRMEMWKSKKSHCYLGYWVMAGLVSGWTVREVVLNAVHSTVRNK